MASRSLSAGSAGGLAGKLREAMGMDKKVLGKQLRFILLDGLGSARVSSDYDEALLDNILASAAA